MVKIVALITAAFVAGWYLNDLQHDRLELSITRAANTAAEKGRTISEDIASDSARKLEDKLEVLRQQRDKYQPVIHTEIIKPVFTNVCATDEYVRLFNESSDAAERALSGKSAD
ncbi:hypothetical protein RF657_08545 [Yersinia rochesterensis]|uniref:hypothetical protein n=1 Tax=Yersinia rochesterensis TaxID=1604335 RepID=UPI0028530244|nr:hypothetical protein [Yersinia rochesterensis]MDR5018442.1 hypothetical protein [Yersinia rochesterensis]